MSGSLLYYLDLYIAPAVFVLGVFMMYFHLRRGRVNLAKRITLSLPMFLAYWAWFRLLVPHALYYDTTYVVVLFLVTGAFMLYLMFLFKIYPEDK